MNRNYKIKTISIPELNEEGDETGINIILEVVSMEKLKTIVSTPEGGTLTTEEIYFVCFENEQGKPKKLHILNADSKGEITILKLEKYARQSTKSWSQNKTHRRTNRENRVNNNS